MTTCNDMNESCGPNVEQKNSDTKANVLYDFCKVKANTINVCCYKSGL